MSKRCPGANGRVWAGWRAWAAALVLPGLLTGGCVRRFYRDKADQEVSHLLTEKSQDPRWSLEGYYVYPDPRARFADGSDPDHPPMPPDDPAAYELSPNPQKPGKAGAGRVE